MQSVAAALTLSLIALAAPSPADTAVQVPVVDRRGVALPFFYPEPVHKTFDPNPALAKRSVPSDAEDLSLAKEELVKQLGLASVEDLQITESHRDSAGVMHVYAVEKINGVSVDNHNAAIHIQHGQVLSLSSSFAKSSKSKRSITVAAPVAALSVDEATKIAEKYFGVPRDTFPAKKVYVQIPNGDLVLAHQFQLRDDAKSKWYQVSVDTTSGKIVQAVDYYNEFSAKVLALPKLDPREGFEVVKDPFNPVASPKGWNSDGNNLISSLRGATVDGGASLDFTHNWDGTKETDDQQNKNAATINNFYVSNMVHDITYVYGFDEASGNFQANNFGKGGRANDRVRVNNQASGSNNANFATPPDGQSGTMNMFTWTRTTPKRDGSLENDIPIHEYGHGVSNRLTGGSAQGNCLGGTTSGGMGEGWSDTLANYFTRRATDTRDMTVTLGSYVTNTAGGIRRFPYSTDMKVNPDTFSIVSTLSGVHAYGSYWAEVLWEMYWNLVDQYGFSANLFDPKQQKGNIIAIQLVIGGMKLQPCNPRFISARDAILAADKAYYGGANKCLIWKAFAKRGLGVDAVEAGFKDGFKLPADC